MRLLRQKKASIASLVLLAALAVEARPLAASLMAKAVVVSAAAATTYPLPSNVPVGTSIRIGGSSSMETINQALKQRFEQQFVGTTVELNTQGTGPALKDVLDGNADLAAIGRSLTDQERSQGLIQVPVSRHKIAVIVGSENSFKGTLSFEEFAKIFRGEIRDWSQLGDAPGLIRFIDRPDSSDTRQAFRNYAVFKQAPFVAGPNTKQLAQDSTSQVVQALGKDGIGYAIVDQLSGRGDVRVIPMHKTLPSNPKYPFSQPLVYVYKGPQPNPAAQAFLGYATAPVSRQTIETARKQEAIAPPLPSSEPKSPSPDPILPSPKATPTPQPASPSTSATPSANGETRPIDRSNVWWLWLLTIPLVGALLWWLLKNRDVEPEPEIGEMPVAVDPVPTIDSTGSGTVTVAPLPPIGAAAPAGSSRLILVPRSCTDAYAYWEVPDDVRASLQQQNARKPVLRLYDVTGIDIHQRSPESLQEFDCDEQTHDRYVPIRTDDRDYIAELGYVAEDGRWLQVARSEPVHVPACPPGSTPVGTGGDVFIEDETPPVPGNDSAPPISVSGTPPQSIDDQTPLPGSGSETLLQPIDDQTPLPSSGSAPPISDSGTPSQPSQPLYDEVKIGGAALAAGTTVVGGAVFADDAARSLVAGSAGDQSDEGNQDSGRIILVPHSATDAYVYWEVTEAAKVAQRQQGGQQLALRLYDVTNSADLKRSPSGYQQFKVDELVQDQHVPIPTADRDYAVELGYVTSDDQWLKLARSATVRVSSNSTPAAVTGGSTATMRVGDSRETTLQMSNAVPLVTGEAAADMVRDRPAVAHPPDLALSEPSPIKISETTSNSRIILVPRTAQAAYVYWEVPEDEKDALKQQGGQQLMLKVYAVNNSSTGTLSIDNVQQFYCNDWEQDLHVPIPVNQRNYVAELGYVTANGQLLPLTKSSPVYIPGS